VNTTVKIYCGGVLSTTATRAFKTDNDMWVVGKVRFGSNGTCTFTADNYAFSMP
jgi:hypothetical protein